MMMTQVFANFQQTNQLNEAINEDLGKLDMWLKGNKLSSNIAKTQSMLITTKHRKKYLQISGQTYQPSIRKTCIEVVSNNLYLSVQIVDHLSWKEHMKAVTAKA